MKTQRIIFEPSQDYPVPSIYTFAIQINSLYRYWHFCSDKIKGNSDELVNRPAKILSEYEEELEKFKRKKANGITHDKETAFFYKVGWSKDELLVDFEDNEAGDIEEFPLFLCYSVTASSVKIFHQMLYDLAKEITAKDEFASHMNSKEFWAPGKKFTQDIDQIVGIDEVKKENTFPAIKAAFEKLEIDIEQDLLRFKEIESRPENSNEFVELCFDEVLMIVQHIESACIKYFKEN